MQEVRWPGKLTPVAHPPPTDSTAADELHIRGGDHQGRHQVDQEDPATKLFWNRTSAPSSSSTSTSATKYIIRKLEEATTEIKSSTSLSTKLLSTKYSEKRNRKGEKKFDTNLDENSGRKKMKKVLEKKIERKKEEIHTCLARSRRHHLQNQQLRPGCQQDCQCRQDHQEEVQRLHDVLDAVREGGRGYRLRIRG
jgi:hypothetical protein